MSAFFNLAANLLRHLDEALQRRAIAQKLIITQCAWCKAFMGEKPTEGQPGISHSICAKCVPVAIKVCPQCGSTNPRYLTDDGQCSECVFGIQIGGAHER